MARALRALGDLWDTVFNPLSPKALHVTPKQYNLIVKMMGTLHLSRSEVRGFAKIFNQIDVDTSGEISMMEFLNFFKMEKTEFNQRTFRVMDIDGSGKVDLFEFISSIYNYCTFDHVGLVRYAFELYDEDKSGSLELFEVIELVKYIYGRALDEKITKILENMDKDGSGTISLNEFGKANKNHPILLFPAFHVQEVMRMKVFGAKFWAQKVAETRGKDHSKMMNTLRNMEAAMQKGDMHAVMGESSKSVDQTPTSAKGAGGAPGGGLVSDDDARAAHFTKKNRVVMEGGRVIRAEDAVFAHQQRQATLENEDLKRREHLIEKKRKEEWARANAEFDKVQDLTGEEDGNDSDDGPLQGASLVTCTPSRKAWQPPNIQENSPTYSAAINEKRYNLKRSRKKLTPLQMQLQGQNTWQDRRVEKKKKASGGSRSRRYEVAPTS